MMKEKFKEYNSIALSKWYTEECKSFYLPYLPPKERKKEYSFRKNILKLLREKAKEELRGH